MLEEARELAGWSKESEALSIYQALGQIEDRRGKKGKRYGLALVLTCVLLAKMAGETTLQAEARMDPLVQCLFTRGLARHTSHFPLWPSIKEEADVPAK